MIMTMIKRRKGACVLGDILIAMDIIEITKMQ